MTVEEDSQSAGDLPLSFFNLGQVLRRSLDITLRQRVLWLYGFLLALFGGDCVRIPGGSFDINEDQAGRMERALRSLDPDLVLTWAFFALVVTGILALVLLVVGNWATGSLIGGVRQSSIEGGASFRAAAQQGRRHFWRLLLLGLVSSAIVLAVMLPAVATVALSVLAAPVFLVTLCLWGPLVLIFLLLLSLLVTIAQVHVVLDEAGPLSSLRFAWRFLKRHAGDLALVWLVNNVAVGCSAGCALTAVAALAAVPAVIGFLINPAVGIVLLVPAALGALLVAFLAGIVQVFHKAVWVLSYERLREMDEQADVESGLR